MPTKTNNITINQCLLGYDNGHQLLASSVEIPSEALALLLLLSDSASGLKTRHFDSYWTGFPIPAMKAYALLHTWPAPEISRPGCVWTHGIFINFAELSKIQNLHALQNLFMRPSKEKDYSSYFKTQIFDAASLPKTSSIVQPDEILALLRALYSTPKKQAYISNSERLSNALFAVWSQQWPRLQRSFSFRTAAVPMRASAAIPQCFDLLAVLERINNDTPLPNDWESEVILDIISGPTSLRSFLKKYGADMLRGKERFRFLANVFTNCKKIESYSALCNLLDYIAITLPDPTDGAILKKDLIMQADTTSSLLPTIPPIHIWTYLAQSKNNNYLPVPVITSATFDKMWKKFPQKTLEAANDSILSCPALATQLTNYLSQTISAENFYRSVMEYKHLRKELLAINPSLLNSDMVEILAEKDFELFVAFLPDTYHEASAVFTNLFFTRNESIIQKLNNQRPRFIQKYAQIKITESLITNSPSFSRGWIKIIENKALLTRYFLRRATSFSEVERLIELLDMDVEVGIKAGISAWVKALAKVHHNNKYTSKKLFLDVYLLAMALTARTSKCVSLIEESFRAVHTALQNSLLSKDLFEVLDPLLPQIRDNWDNCYRLRLAVAQLYIKEEFSFYSFIHLANEDFFETQLLHALVKIDGGRRYFYKHHWQTTGTSPLPEDE